MTIASVAMGLAFVGCGAIAVAGALGMATTMSMFRGGIFLMASLMGVGGLFILLLADLIGLLQVMMYLGGMLVMLLFMVLFSMDPGGAMMAAMPMAPIERLFTLGLKRAAQDDSSMDMGNMRMVTPARRVAALGAMLVAGALVALIMLRPSWPVDVSAPDPDSARQIGNLLLGKYMMGFEGAGLLILLGIFGAVLMGHPDHHPSPRHREACVAIDEPPRSVDLPEEER